MLKLGVKARDVVSGWEGTITSRHEYLNGCVRYEIAGTDKDGKPEDFVFDEQQIEVLGDDGPLVNLQVTAAGGPRSNRPVPR